MSIKIKNIKNINIKNRRFKNSEINNRFNKYDFFILPSNYEGCPKILLEAMFNGMICFVFDLPNIKEIIKDKQNGIYLKRDLKKMSELLNNISELDLEKISYNASVFVRSKFTLYDTSNIELNVYDKLLK